MDTRMPTPTDTTARRAVPTTPPAAALARAARPGRDADGFDRRLFVDTIAVVAMIALPVVLGLAAWLDRPYLLIAVAIVIPALCAVPVALERRHREHRV